ncbi:roadblock/LC7 domain-containing protein [Streptomyces albus]|uniref:roadblock/LC7 domain-containing protein n=1 Tax=Streptomyces TaxID=1883 RepID=UPI001CEC7C0E|nr:MULTISPECIES: roadblock/LC7 domain-containing protein [Streptomyces]
MTAEARVAAELRRVRVRVPQVEAVLAATVDGFVLAQDSGPSPRGGPPEAEPLAALTAAALGLAFRMNEATGRGAFRELLVHGELGYVATYAAGPAAVLTLLADERINVGRLHLEGRRTAARIGELVAGAQRQPAPPGPGGPQPAAPPPPEGHRPPLERRRGPLPAP